MKREVNGFSIVIGLIARVAGLIAMGLVWGWGWPILALVALSVVPADLKASDGMVVRRSLTPNAHVARFIVEMAILLAGYTAILAAWGALAMVAAILVFIVQIALE